MVELDKSGIYQITNILNGKIYIGYAKNILKRWKKHIRHANYQKHHSIKFQRAWNKYGEKSFSIKILEECSIEKLLEREQHWLDLLTPYDDHIGYNICKIGINQIGLKRSEQAKENMRNGQLGKVRSFEHRENISLGNSRPDKWPCPDKSKCKCAKCRKIKNKYVADRRKIEAEKEGRIVFNRMRLVNA